jgi:hypothetical protein
MNILFLSFLLLAQGIPVQQSGTVTGVLRNADGKPAAGVRISAVPQTDALEQGPASPTLSSIAETDAAGRYRLENIPPGRYYIAAGRLDRPTYYPGTQSMAIGRTILVSAGLFVSDIDFVLVPDSAGRAEPTIGAPGVGVVLLDLPLDVRVEGGGKLPVLNGGKQVTVQLTPVTGTNGPILTPINAPRISIPPPITDYRVSVEDLPEGYTVKSTKTDSTELPDRILRITAVANANGNISWVSSAAYAAYMTAFSAGTPMPTAPTKALVITMSSPNALPTRSAGARVTGSLPPNMLRPIRLGSAPGIVFSDGTFEFRNVPPGRQVITTLDNFPSKRALVASVVVGSNDLNGMELFSTPVLPSNIRAVLTGSPAGTRSPGSQPLASLRGQILDAETGKPLTGGTIYIVGDSWASFELESDGQFKFEKLLPGNYELEVQGRGYPTFRRPVVIEEQDIDLELKAG